MIQHIHTVTVASGQDGQWFWKTLLPPLVAAIVPVVAIWFSWRQSERSAELTRQQAKDTNAVALRQVEIAAKQAEIAERKLLHETYEARFQGWVAVDEASRTLYRIVMNASDGQSLTREFFHEFRAFSEAELSARMLFADDVGEAINELEQAIYRLNVMRSAMFSTAVADTRRDEALGGGFQEADLGYQGAVEAFRQSVRRHLIWGVGQSEMEA